MVSLPSWLKAATPAEFQAEGMRIADSRDAQANEVAERGAAGERAQQELMLRQQQLEAQATQAAQKYAAQRQYQDAIASGTDPVQALLKFGPAMGNATGVGAALHAQQLRQPKPQLPPPSFQTIQGPDGQPMKVMMQNGHIINPNQYTPKPPPVQETWTKYKDPDTGIPMIKSSKTGRPEVDPAFKEQQRQQGQVGKVTQQAQAKIRQLNKEKADNQKTLDAANFTQLAQQHFKKKTVTHDELEAFQTELETKIKDADNQIEKLTGGGESKADSAPHPDGTVLKNKKDGKTYVVKDGVPVPQEEQ
jgi:hypothetical protein